MLPSRVSGLFLDGNLFITRARCSFVFQLRRQGFCPGLSKINVHLAMERSKIFSENGIAVTNKGICGTKAGKRPLRKQEIYSAREFGG